MKLFSTKKKIAALVGAGALVLGAAGIAAAYFTATGTGTGSATVTTPANLKVTVTPVTFTGAGTQHVHFTVHNPNSYSVDVKKASITGVTATKCYGVGHTTKLSWLSATATVGTIPASGSASITTTTQRPTITLATTATYTQSSCKVTFTVHV